MKEKLVDMHTHSYFSDGTMSPEELLASALEKGVGLLALTDHDMLEGTRRLSELCCGQDLLYIPGVELDSLEDKVDVHILGYGINLEDEEFDQFVKTNLELLYKVNSMLIEKMQADYDCISYQEYMNYQYDRRKGGWKALHYLMEKGVTHSLREGFPLYPQYGCTYDRVDFLTVKEVCDRIHKAGGKAVLAHPGVTIKEPDIQKFKDEVSRLLDYGIDGIECYYPKHSAEITRVCLELCKDRDLLITTGSDCHGSFGNAEVGETHIPISRLNLKGLL